MAFAATLGIECDPWQADVLRSDHPRKILCCARQTGKSTVGAVLAVHEALTSPGSTTLVVAPGERQAKLLYSKAAALYRRAGYPLRARSDRRTGLELSNGSVIEALPAVERTVRGYSVDLLIADEAAGIPDPDYHGLLPTLIATHGRQLLLSTPRGKRGFFHDLWMGGGPEWKRVKVTANESPRIRPGDLGAYRKAMPERWFRQEFYCEFLDTDSSVFAHDLVMGAVDPEVEPITFEEDEW